MNALVSHVQTFPSVRMPSHSGGLPVEVSLIAQLGHGAGDQIIASVGARQRQHEAFVDELDEPSARLGGINLEQGDASSLYSFTVGAGGHPFHRHAGHRVFTAISGSAGTQLRFSTASSAQTDEDPSHFVRALRHVNIPPDCLFTVRFGGGTWHQFVPLAPRSSHPALFALSCHTNELGGDLPEHVRALVAANDADIPALTEVLPEHLRELLRAVDFDPAQVATISLSLDAPAMSGLARACTMVRGTMGRLRTRLAAWRAPRGYLSDNGAGRRVVALQSPPADSLLREQFCEGFDHQDSFSVHVSASEAPGFDADRMLEALLDGFLLNRSPVVSRLMGLRNLLVRPLGLRTSPLGCPVSSLLSPEAPSLFAGRFPVLGQRSAADGAFSQVVLGADDKHLAFRSCAGLRRMCDGELVFTLGTRVLYRNLFGRFYMWVIDRVHRSYVSPTMLRMAVDHALASTLRESPRLRSLDR